MSKYSFHKVDGGKAPVRIPKRRQKMTSPTTLFKGDTHILLISALRYAIGRTTYVPSTIVEFMQENWDSIHEKTKNIMRQDLKRAIEDHMSGRLSLGAEWDFQLWVRLYEFLIKDQQEEIEKLKGQVREYRNRLEYLLFACDEHGKECEEYLSLSKEERDNP